ncbi:MAG: DUF6272 family protein [Rhodospirillaceae bacterium]
MTDVIGDFKAVQSSGETECLSLSFSPGSRPIKQRWRNNGLSADFLGDYVTTFFPKEEEDTATISRQAEIKNAVTYIANELLENAMKYADERFAIPITIRLEMHQDMLVFSESNAIGSAQAATFRAFIDWLSSGDPEVLYMEALENSATREDGGSGLGLITMMNDYGARLAWQIDPNDDDSVVVTTQVTISV